MAERWKTIPSFPDYKASSYGKIKRAKPNRQSIARHGGRSDGILSPTFDSRGRYLVVCVQQRGKAKTISVHSLVAEAFLGPKPKGLTVNHKDGVKTNNRSRNLEYMTHSEQQIHARDLGLRVWGRGENHANAILTEKQVKEILKLEGKLAQKQIAKIYGVSRPTINGIYKGRLWSYLTGRKVA